MRRSPDPSIRLIAFFELLKGTLVAIGALGLLTMIHKERRRWPERGGPPTPR